MGARARMPPRARTHVGAGEGEGAGEGAAFQVMRTTQHALEIPKPPHAHPQVAEAP